MTFAILFFTGFVAATIFASRALAYGAASDVAGACFGAVLMGVAVLTLTGA